MRIDQITSKVGAHRRRRRVGRGPGSGRGKTSGRGHKGGGARAGWGGRTLNEGGALPLFRRVPIRGFSNAQFQVRYQVVNVAQLDKAFAGGADVTAEKLAEAGLVNPSKGPVKVLADGSLDKKLTVTADAFSAAAVRKITGAGGTVNDLSGRTEARARAEAAARARAQAQAAARARAEAEAQAKAEAKAEAKAKAKAEKAEKKAKAQPQGEPKADAAAAGDSQAATQDEDR